MKKLNQTKKIWKIIPFIVLIKSGLHAKPYNYLSTEREIYAEKVSNEFIKEVSDEFGLLVEAYGGSMPEKIEKINLRFQFNKPVTVEEARWLLINLRKKLAYKVNENEKNTSVFSSISFYSN